MVLLDFACVDGVVVLGLNADDMSEGPRPDFIDEIILLFDLLLHSPHH